MKNHSANLAQNPQLDGSSTKKAWRSMASAPKNRSSFLGIVTNYGTIPIVEIGYVCEDGRHFQASNNCQYALDEMLAWAPIPHWTGEVAE